MGKNKTQTLDEATKLIEGSELAPDLKSENLSDVQSMTKKEIQEFINNFDDSLNESEEEEEFEEVQEGEDPEVPEEAPEVTEIIVASKKTITEKYKDIFKCNNCDFRTRNKKVKCGRHPLSKMVLVNRK